MATERASEALWPAYEKACKILSQYLDNKLPGGDKVKVATFIAGSMAKTMGAEAHKQTLELMQKRQAERAWLRLVDKSNDQDAEIDAKSK